MALTYSKNEKLKSKYHIDLLFSEGNSVSSYPVRLIYSPIDGNKSKFGVSVSKRNFKHAVDRNEIKRSLRESYRINQHTLKKATENQAYVFMLLFQSKEKMPFNKLENKVTHLFEKFGTFIANNTTDKETTKHEK